MENVPNLLWVFVGLALFLNAFGLFLAFACLYRLMQQPPAFSWTVSTTPPTGTTQACQTVITPLETPRVRRKKEKPITHPYVCIHCRKYLPWEPHHGVVHEQKSYVVYVCENCGKETELPAPSAGDAAQESV